MNKTKLIAFAILLSTASCKSYKYSGNHVAHEEAVKIRVGITKDEVVKIAGHPSIIEGDTWLYVSRTLSKRGLSNLSVTNQEIIKVEFDRNAVKTSEVLVDGHRDVQIDPFKTELKRKDSSIFKQFYENLGKYSTKSGDKKLR